MSAVFYYEQKKIEICNPNYELNYLYIRTYAHMILISSMRKRLSLGRIFGEKQKKRSQKTV